MEHAKKANAYQLQTAISHAVLDLHILPTEQCNFRCVYCYEDFLLGKMHRHVINGIKNLIQKRAPELRQLRLSWFGGEPLAAIDVVLEISNYAKALAKQYQYEYNFGITTNGYLLDKKRFESLIEAGVHSFQISLDGTKESHDTTRLRADGKGTFDKIWLNLLNIAKTKHKCEIMLRVHVTPENHGSVAALLQMIKLNFKYDTRFKVFLKAIANLGGPNAGTFEVLTGKTKEELLAQLHAILGDEMQAHQLDKPNAPYICYASAQNAWVIRANGTLAKCTVMFNDERNKIGYLNENGTLILEHDKIQLWLRGLKDNNANVMSCPAHKLPKLVTDKFQLVTQ